MQHPLSSWVSKAVMDVPLLDDWALDGRTDGWEWGWDSAFFSCFFFSFFFGRG